MKELPLSERPYEKVLEKSLADINPKLPKAAIDEALFKIKNFENAALIQKNLIFTDYLQNGIPVRYCENEIQKDTIVYLIDYKNQSEFLDAIEGVKTINMGQDCLRLAKENTLEKEEAAFLEYFQKAVSQ